MSEPCKIRFFPLIDKKRCKQCGLCLHFCPRKVLDQDKDGYPDPARPEDCQGCGLCFDHCPDFAVEVEKYESA